MKNIMTGAYTYSGEPLNFNFGTDLLISEKAGFVNSVVDLVVVDEDYNSVIKDLVFDFYVIDYFTDVDVKELKKSLQFLNDVEEFLEETNIVDIVKANMVIGLLEELENAVNKSIEYRTGIHPSPIADSLASLINTLEKKVNEFDMGDMMGMAQKFMSMTGELTPESVVNAYINSDMHQKNLEEIAESKKNEIEIDENLGEAVRSVVKESKAEKADNDNEK